MISKTKEYLNTSDDVMDFGCATGTKTLELAGVTKQIHGIFPLHLNMLKTNDVENLIVNGKFQIVKAEKIFNGITFSFIIARKL